MVRVLGRYRRKASLLVPPTGPSATAAACTTSGRPLIHGVAPQCQHGILHHAIAGIITATTASGDPW